MNVTLVGFTKIKRSIDEYLFIDLDEAKSKANLFKDGLSVEVIKVKKKLAIDRALRGLKYSNLKLERNKNSFELVCSYDTSTFIDKSIGNIFTSISKEKNTLNKKENVILVKIYKSNNEIVGCTVLNYNGQLINIITTNKTFVPNEGTIYSFKNSHILYLCINILKDVVYEEIEYDSNKCSKQVNGWINIKDFKEMMDENGLEYHIIEKGLLNGIVPYGEKMYIPSGITGIESCGFNSCHSISLYKLKNSKVKELYIPNTVKYIRSGAFNYECFKHIEKIVIQGNNTDVSKLSIEEIQNRELNFYGLSGLENVKEIIIGKGITYIRDSFIRLNSLKKLDIENSDLLIIKSCFNNCKNLEEIKLPKKLYETTDCFNYNTINKVKLSDSTNKINASFNYCNIAEINFSDKSNIESIYGSFKNSPIELIDLSMCNKLKKIDYLCFTNCTNVKELKLPDSLLHFSIGNGPKLKLKLPNNIKSVKDLGNLIVESIPTSIDYFVQTKDGFKNDIEFIQTDNSTKLNKYMVPKGDKNKLDLSKTKIKEIGEDAFSNKDYSEIKLPITVEKIKSEAYSDVKNIPFLDLYDLDKVKEIEESVFINSSFECIILPRNIECLCDKALCKIDKLKYVYIPSSVVLLGKNWLKGTGKDVIKGTTIITDKEGVISKSCNRRGIECIVLNSNNKSDIIDTMKNNARKITESKLSKYDMMYSDKYKDILSNDNLRDFADKLIGVRRKLDSLLINEDGTINENHELSKTVFKRNLDTSNFRDFDSQKSDLALKFLTSILVYDPQLNKSVMDTKLSESSREANYKEFYLDPMFVSLSNFFTKTTVYNLDLFLNENANVSKYSNFSIIYTCENAGIYFMNTKYKNIENYIHLIIVIGNRIVYVAPLQYSNSKIEESMLSLSLIKMKADEKYINGNTINNITFSCMEIIKDNDIISRSTKSNSIIDGVELDNRTNSQLVDNFFSNKALVGFILKEKEKVVYAVNLDLLTGKLIYIRNKLSNRVVKVWKDYSKYEKLCTDACEILKIIDVDDIYNDDNKEILNLIKTFIQDTKVHSFIGRILNSSKNKDYKQLKKQSIDNKLFNALVNIKDDLLSRGLKTVYNGSLHGLWNDIVNFNCSSEDFLNVIRELSVSGYKTEKFLINAKKNYKLLTRSLKFNGDEDESITFIPLDKKVISDKLMNKYSFSVFIDLKSKKSTGKDFKYDAYLCDYDLSNIADLINTMVNLNDKECETNLSERLTDNIYKLNNYINILNIYTQNNYEIIKIDGNDTGISGKLGIYMNGLNGDLVLGYKLNKRADKEKEEFMYEVFRLKGMESIQVFINYKEILSFNASKLNMKLIAMFFNGDDEYNNLVDGDMECTYLSLRNAVLNNLNDEYSELLPEIQREIWFNIAKNSIN